jgi:DNA-binding CsgD family transcriptional regulator
MAARTTIADSDVRLILDLADSARAGERGTHVPHSMVGDLATLVPYDLATFQIMNLHEGWISLQESDSPVAVDDNNQLDVWWPAWWECCSYPQRTGDYVSILRDSDRIPGTEPGPHWARFLETRPDYPKWRVIVPMTPIGRIDRRLGLFRDSGPDFSDREVRLLALLRPHLAELFELHQQACNPLPDLTLRQRQILSLVADGQTNGQIARQLGVSEGTVRKHLENAYARLGVTNRVAAIRAAQDVGRAG